MRNKKGIFLLIPYFSEAFVYSYAVSLEKEENNANKRPKLQLCLAAGEEEKVVKDVMDRVVEIKGYGEVAENAENKLTSWDDFLEQYQTSKGYEDKVARVDEQEGEHGLQGEEPVSETERFLNDNVDEDYVWKQGEDEEEDEEDDKEDEDYVWEEEKEDLEEYEEEGEEEEEEGDEEDEDWHVKENAIDPMWNGIHFTTHFLYFSLLFALLLFSALLFAALHFSSLLFASLIFSNSSNCVT